MPPHELLIAVVAIAQEAPRFEVASVRPTPSDGGGPPIGMRITGARIQISGYSLKDYVGMAYPMEPPQVIAPEWMTQQRFEIAIDATGLTDRFDFSLDLSQEDYSFAMMRAAINNGYSVSPQGLRALEERKAPLDVVVVDSVSRTPTEN